MSRKTLFPALAFLILALSVLPGSSMAATPTLANSTSVAGYQLTAATGNNITSIKASWIVPTVTCSGMTNSYSNMSVMIDGFVSPKADQLRIGTYSNCIGGVATYGAFYVLNLAGGIFKQIQPLPTVKAGDLIQATGSWNAGGTPKHGGNTNQGWRATLTDTTAGVTGKLSDKSKTKAALNSAAVVVSGKPGAALADFGTVGFGYSNTGVRSTCELTAGFANNTVFKSLSIGVLGSQKGFTLTQDDLIDQSSVILATAGALDTKGKSFSVTWNAAT